MSDPAIVLVTTSFPMCGDGSEAAGAFVADLALELARHVDVRVVAPGEATRRERWASRIEVFRYAAPSRPLSTLRVWQPADALRVLNVLRAGAEATRAAVGAGPTAHVVALWALPSGAWARAAAHAAGVRYTVWTLGSDIWTWAGVPIVRAFLRRILQQADHLFADGLRLADDTARIAGRAVDFLPSSRSITGGERAAATVAPFRFLFLGRWHRNKGVDLLLDALDLLEDADWNRISSIEVAGGGPLEALVNARAARLQRRGRPVVVSGFLDKPAAAAAIERADWLLIPSRIESIPVVFSDAMKLARPVIAMPVGDLPALLAQDAVGLCAETLSAADFAKAMRRALHAPIDRSHAIAAMARRFSLPEAIVPSLLALPAQAPLSAAGRSRPA